jgi:hypothetical protein
MRSRFGTFKTSAVKTNPFLCSLNSHEPKAQKGTLEEEKAKQATWKSRLGGPIKLAVDQLNIVNKEWGVSAARVPLGRKIPGEIDH